ncbi:winged helix-turn-helix transcriptional regulator [Actinomadura sp. HBU206391]|uniref:winged helix-turn-helix transcriptional regulator n=1 Tax=Actinomadura sp. HBU206391 TaxID=2731692 RepID=UPI00164FAFAD|nr:winged helix-turn-helix transcriptional regulator [Actinomadura sp. HBU206391]MBC6459490.1 transcriptional regulator [Actinomadura sp. HBU206391]
MSGRRSYNDPCGIARGLNLVGERWALLVVRELLLGPKRFTDLHRGLPTASQNVLSQRLRELEQDGVIRRRKLGPPAGTWVYELTEWGYDLEPVLAHLGRWGSRAPVTSTAGSSADSLVLALRDMFAPHAAGDLRGSYELRLGDDRFRATVAEGRIELVRGSAEQPDAIIETDVATLWGLILGERRFDETLRSGDLTLEGDHRAGTRFTDLFRASPMHGQTVDDPA